MKPLRSPIKVSVDLTSRCNLSCVHCRNTLSPPPTRGSELTFSEICAVLDDLGRQMVLRVGLSGGEPFLRADTPEIIRHAAGCCAGRVLVSTNGTLVDSRLLDELEPARGRLTLKVSLDGPREIHDAARGRAGAFDLACEAIRLCHSRGFRAEVTTTVASHNLDHLEELSGLAMSLGCHRHHFVEVLPVGSATRQLCLGPEERGRALEIGRRLQAANPDRVTVKLPFAAGEPGRFRCEAGVSECGVLSDGSIVGCRLLPHIREGNVRDQPLGETWSAPAAFSFFRGWEKTSPDGACKACGSFGSCGGGCRAYAYGLSGDARAHDPRCAYVPPVTGGDLR